MPFEGRIMHHLHEPIRVITKFHAAAGPASMRRRARPRKYSNGGIAAFQPVRRNSHNACAPGFGWRASSGRSR
jgi:hypothetical protein